jgi:branched-chain amino acid aminotransferase
MDPKIHHCNLIQSILAKIEATNAGADDAIMLDRNGFVAETNATHVFIARKGMLETSTCNACPQGITRAAVLDLCERNGIPVRVRDISLPEVYCADEMFCTGTMGELVAVTKVDGRVIGDGKPGPMTARLSQLFRALTETEGAPIA